MEHGFPTAARVRVRERRRTRAAVENPAPQFNPPNDIQESVQTGGATPKGPG